MIISFTDSSRTSRASRIACWCNFWRRSCASNQLQYKTFFAFNFGDWDTCQIVMKSFGYGTLSGRQIMSMLEGNYYLLQGYQLWRFCKSDGACDLFNLLQHTKDSAGNIDCDEHMKHQVSVRIQDSCLLECDAVLLGYWSLELKIIAPSSTRVKESKTLVIKGTMVLW